MKRGGIWEDAKGTLNIVIMEITACLCNCNLQFEKNLKIESFGRQRIRRGGVGRLAGANSAIQRKRPPLGIFMNRHCGSGISMSPKC